MNAEEYRERLAAGANIRTVPLPRKLRWLLPAAIAAQIGTGAGLAFVLADAPLQFKFCAGALLLAPVIILIFKSLL